MHDALSITDSLVYASQENGAKPAMRVIKVVEGVRTVVKVGILTTLAVLVPTGVLPTDSGDVGVGIF